MTFLSEKAFQSLFLFAAGGGNQGLYWKITLGVIVVGTAAFLIYRLIDVIQISFTKGVEKPGDLKLGDVIFEKKRGNKLKRLWKLIRRASGSWLIHGVYIVFGMGFVVAFFRKFGLKDGTIYTLLTFISFLLNILISKLFGLWNPSRPFVCRSVQRESVWSPGNLLWQAWGLASWAVPVYFFYAAYGVNGWIGSVIFIVLSQIVQLLIFIFTIKKQAIPYRDYPGLSEQFKENLSKYLQSQGIRDDEVGIIPGDKIGPNAFATSFTSKLRQIVLTEPLIKGYTDPTNPEFTMKLGEDTIEAVVAHEVGHVVHHHVEKAVFAGIFISSIVTVSVYYIFSNFTPPTWMGFPADVSGQIKLYWGNSLFNIMLTYPLTFIMLGLIRGNEWQADTHLLKTNGCKKGYDFFYQIRHIAPVPNHPAWARCNMTHPDPKVREDRMRQWEKEHC